MASVFLWKVAIGISCAFDYTSCGCRADKGYFRRFSVANAPEFSAPAEPSRMAVNQQHLKQAWVVSQVLTKEEWEEWVRRLSVKLMARQLFNAAFLSCWTELYDQYQVSHSLINFYLT